MFDQTSPRWHSAWRHRRRLGIISALALLAVVVGFGGAGSAKAQPEPSDCLLTMTAASDTPVILMGDTATVDITVVAACPDSRPTVVFLALDAGASPATAAALRDAARRFVAFLELDEYPQRRVGVLQFSAARTRLVCEATNDERTAIGCINRVGAGGGDALESGLRASLDVLAMAREGAGDPDRTRFVLLVLTGGAADDGCTGPLEVASDIKSQGNLVITACPIEGCDFSCVRQIASSPRYFLTLADHVPGVMAMLLPGPFALSGPLQLRLDLGDAFSVVPGSVLPRATMSGPRLDWRTVGHTFVGQLKVVGTLPGSHRVGLWDAAWRDVNDVEGAAQGALPVITVLRPVPLPPPGLVDLD